MRRLPSRVLLGLAFFTMGIIGSTGPILAQNVGVSPNCGTTATHFLVSGGLPGTPKPCPDSCHVPAVVRIDSNVIYSFDCGTPFSFDLQNVPGRPPGQECVACGLANGTHILKLSTTGAECSGDIEQRPSYCVQVSFDVVSAAANGNPWVNAFTLSADGQLIALNFAPCTTCDVAPCDSMFFIQVVRPRAPDSQGNLVKYTYTQQHWPGAARIDSLLTTAGYKVDVGVNARVPYYLGKFPGFNTSVASIGVKDGSCGAAYMIDNPSRGDDAYRPGVSLIVLEFEANVFCAAGGGRHQWLGRITWTWQQAKGATDFIVFGDATRDQPTAAFMDALNQWSSLRSFSLPSQPTPTSGGVACN